MDPNTRVRLQEAYRDDILRLETLIGRDLKHWMEQPVCPVSPGSAVQYGGKRETLRASPPSGGIGLEIPDASNTDEHGRRVGRIARGAGAGTFGGGLGRLLGFTVQLVLARLYGPAQLGLYVLGTTVLSLANVLSQIGMDSGVVRYVSQHRVSGDDSRTKGIIAQALLTTVALSVLLASALFFGAGLLAQGLFDIPALEPVLKVFSLSLPFLTLMTMAFWAVEGFQMVKYRCGCGRSCNCW